MNCPCQPSTKYNICCGRYHLGTLYPPTAEALSRARHSAYVLNKPIYIYNTWDESTRPPLEAVKLLMQEKYIDFKIIHKDMGLEEHDIGMVTYLATYNSSNDDPITYKELSLFKRNKGKWIFHKSERK